MSKASVRNAPVAALIYEFLHDVYVMIDVDRSYLSWLANENTTPLGAFDQRFTSKWEWSASILKKVGAIIPVEPPHLATQGIDTQRGIVQTPFYTPIMCQSASNVGSDSISLIFWFLSALFPEENQRHASPVSPC